MFIDPSTGQPMNYTVASDQPLSTGVPGNLATWAKAVGLYGNLSLGRDLRPAIRIAKRGFRVNPDFVQLTESGLPTLQAYPASRQLLLDPSGNPLAVGTLLKNPDLAKTYELIAKDGPAAFYDGPIEQAIVQADDDPVLEPGQTIVTQPGIMATSDLSNYQAYVQEPTHVRYRGLDIYGMAPPSTAAARPRARSSTS
jgi:gamma-glutamyltranspeptidase / glutathione hydrolase